MEKALIILFLIIYLISFTPFSNEVYLGGEIVSSDRIFSEYGPQSLEESGVQEFTHATLNTIFLNLPAHYGAFISVFDEDLGRDLILYSFSHRYKKPTYSTFAWTAGVVLGWLLKIVIIVIIIWAIKKHHKKETVTNSD